MYHTLKGETKVIRFPKTKDELEVVIMWNSENTHLPGCVGTIDTLLIPYRVPTASQDLRIFRKFAIVLSSIRLIIDIRTYSAISYIVCQVRPTLCPCVVTVFGKTSLCVSIKTSWINVWWCLVHLWACITGGRCPGGGVGTFCASWCPLCTKNIPGLFEWKVEKQSIAVLLL